MSYLKPDKWMLWFQWVSVLDFIAQNGSHVKIVGISRESNANSYLHMVNI